MGSWQVIYEGRETECRGTAFSAGDEVTWPARFTDPDEPPAAETLVTFEIPGATPRQPRDPC
jgi:hypothetical protein